VIRADVTAAAALAAGLPYQGPLATDGPLRLLYLAAAAGATGRLELRGDDGGFALHLKRGVVEHAASDAPEDALGPFLRARGALDAEGLADAEAVRGSFGGDLVSALVALKLLDPAASVRLLQEHATVIVARALRAVRGTCSWDPAAVAPPSAFPLGSRWGLPCDAARRLDGLVVRQLLGGRAHRIASRSGGRVELSQLKLTAHEARAAGRFDGTASPAQLAARYPGDAEITLRMAYLLGELELLTFGAVAAPESTPAAEPGPATAPTPSRPSAASGRRASARAPAPPPDAPPPGSPPPQPPPRTVRPEEPPTPARPDVAALQALEARLRGADPFDALGVPRDAATAQIKAAYFQLAKLYHPDASLPGEPEQARKLRGDIFARLGEAWGILGDEASRREYLQQQDSGGAPEVDVSRILRAEEIFQDARLLVKARRYPEALAALREATGLNAEEPEFAVWTAWLEFLLAEDRDRQRAASAAEIEAALRKVPRCTAGYLFLAQMAKLTGDPAAAERQLRRGLEVDAENLDLTRELKYLRR
jgi:curved DNA-binding protein CbpA